MNYTILIVDDSQSNIDILNFILEEHDTIPTTSARDALSVLESEKVDLILLDIVMPEIDGFELCKIIKQNSSFKHIPIIFITSRSDEESIERGYDLGGVDYVTKPFKQKELLAKIKTQLYLKRDHDMLQRQIEEETLKRIKQEKAMLSSAKLAEIGEMMSAIVHQWIQPLASISLSMVSLEEACANDKLDKEMIKELTDTVYERVEFLSETINDFRRFFKDDREKMPFVVKLECQKVLSIIKPQLNSSNIEIFNDIEDSASFVGFSNEFKHVMMILINNSKDAIFSKYKGDLGGAIRISSKSEDGFLKIYIKDNGGGMKEEVLKKIFLEKITTKGDSGSGIGLSLARLIVEEHHGGEIRGYNEKEGASFEIMLPLDVH